MKCVDCPFNLLCHAGRLDSWSADQQSLVQLCPACNRLCVGQHETLYIFECEKRQWRGSDASDANDADDANDGNTGRFADLASTRIPDPGPGLLGKLTIARCVDCVSALPPQTRNITIKYLDNHDHNKQEETLAARIAQQRAEAVPAEED